jgi:hypothetical protein
MSKIETLNLDLLIPGGLYNLIKLDSKVPSQRGYPDKYTALRMCRATPIEFVLDEHRNTEAVLFLENYRGEWFRTSPIIKFDIKTLKFETLNSYYQLECIGAG